MISSRALLATVIFCAAQTLVEAAVDYDIVYVRSPRPDDITRVEIPEVKDPIRVPPNTDLMLLRPDGSEEVLVAGGNGAIVDPYISFDGLWVYYAKFHNAVNDTKAGSDIYKINLQTREIVRLTHQEWTPNTGIVTWSNSPVSSEPRGSYTVGHQPYNLGPCPLPDGKVIFTSSRNSYRPNKTFTNPNLQLFVMDNDGSNVELIGHMNLGSALHPTVLMDGRVMFSSYEGQGLRDRRAWGIWAIWPDGRNWEPLMGAMIGADALHFQTQLSNGHLAVVEYYNKNNNGFGTILGFPSERDPSIPLFGKADPDDPSNPLVQRGIRYSPSSSSHLDPEYIKYRFSPQGLYSFTKFTHGTDRASPKNSSGEWAGKVTQPSGAPDNDLLLVWTPGPANDLSRPENRPVYDAGIYRLIKGVPVDDNRDLELIKNDPRYLELQPRAVVTYKEIYGIDEPVKLPWYKNDGGDDSRLEPGTPFGLVGTSSFYRRDTKPGEGASSYDGLDVFNQSANGFGGNWKNQGADAGKYSDSEIYAVRILSMEPTSEVNGSGIGRNFEKGFHNHANERLRILGEIPLRKKNADGSPVMDSTGMPDTSFLTKIPADTPFTFQTIDKEGLVLNMSQTWHQIRPGEKRVNCGGCHAHAQKPLDFEGTAASSEFYELMDVITKTPLLTKNSDGETVVKEMPSTAVDVEFHRDIKPILARSCYGCHSGESAAAELVLDDESPGYRDYPESYNRLARDEGAQHGYPPITRAGRWKVTNASRYIRKFQSRRSLLMWKIFGRRLDGWTNEDHPTESTPGDVSTLPEGANPDLADIDFTGTIMPPPDSDPALYPRLTEDEKMTFARWIDLGCPVSEQGDGIRATNLNWFTDELRPTLAVALPKSGRQMEPLTKIQVGMFDYYSDLDMTTFSVTADFEIDGSAPGTELASQFQLTGDHVWEHTFASPITSLHRGNITVEVADTIGNITNLVRTFTIGEVMTEPQLYVSANTETGEPRLSISGEPQMSQMIEISNDLLEWLPFKELQDFDGKQSLIDTTSQDETRRFYRVKPMDNQN